MKTTSFWTRIKRTFLMFRWLLSLFSRFRHLEQVDLATRKNIIRQAALDALTILNVHLDTDKLPENIHETGRLVVANHISWLDIFVISALLPSGFIAMKEMRSWPMIGKIAENVGTVFIDRSNRKDIEPINAAIVQQLNTGANVCFFPEARTTFGNNILPLKAALFQAAINAHAPIQILALRYYSENQRTEKVSFHNINLLSSFLKIISLPEITVKVDTFIPFLPESDDRFEVKDKVEGLLREVIVSDSPNPNRIVVEETVKY